MRSKLLNTPELYVEPGDNSPEKVSNTTGISAKKKEVYFNQDLRMKYIPNIIEVKTKSVNLARYAKKPTSATSVFRSVLAKL